ncbi:hypothetical protein KR044_000961, partial [Drosophila immigrans]
TNFQCVAHVTFTNLKCIPLNETYGKFEVCRIKAVNRTHKYLSLHETFNVILYNLKMNIKVLRFNHGYKPFFFDLTFDACKYLKNQNDRIINLFFNTFKKRSNLNHTCPYNHDLIVDKFWTGNHEAKFHKYIPIPNGDYVFIATLYIYNYELLAVYTYLKLTS